MLSRPTDLDGLGRLRDLKIFESEISNKDINSEDVKREGNTPGEELLYTN
jgi:hypothetical protein